MRYWYCIILVENTSIYQFNATSTTRIHVCVLVIMDILKNSFENKVISKTLIESNLTNAICDFSFFCNVENVFCIIHFFQCLLSSPKMWRPRFIFSFF